MSAATAKNSKKAVKDSKKEIREKEYAQAGKQKLERQRKALYKPNIICFLVEAVLYIALVVMDTPQVVFDQTSKLFAILLLINVLVPLISLIVIRFANNTLLLVGTMAARQACILTLIIGWVIKYDEMRDCSSYHMLIFYFFFILTWLGMTTALFNVKKDYFKSIEKI